MKFSAAILCAVLTSCFCQNVPTVANAAEVFLPGSPALSPDGSQIAFSYAGDIWTSDSEGGVITRRTVHSAQDSQPLFSPDGKQLAFISNRSGSSQVYVMSVEGGTPKQVTFHTEGYSLLDWSPDGKSLLTQGNRDHHWKRPQRFFSISLEKRSAEKLVFDAYGDEGNISPNGKQILFVREGERWWRKGYHGSRAAQIWLYDVKKETFEKILDDPYGCRSPLWKPDGSGFYYAGAESGTFNLREYDFELKDSSALTEYEDDFVVDPCISHDGSTIVFRHLFDLYRLHPGKDEQPQKIELTFDGDSPVDEIVRRTESNANGASFTEDGLEMAFAAGGDVWVMETELKEPVAVNSTEHFESEPLFVDEGKSLLFVSDEGGQVDIVKATPKDGDLYWWQNEEFEFKKVTNDAATEVNVQRSPDGKHIAFVKEPGALWVTDLDGESGKLITDGFDVPDFDFSPDGKWIVYSRSDNDFNNEVWIVPVDGSREPYNVSRHPDNDYGPAWSPDGRKIAFVGRRFADEVDVYYVYLRTEDDEESNRDRKLEKALEKLNKARKKKTEETKEEPEPKAKEEEKKDEPEKDNDSEEPKNDSEDKDEEKENDKDVKIDFDDLHERVRKISISNSSESGLFWSKDGKTLAFRAAIDGKSGTYTVELPERLQPKLVTSKTGSFLRHLKNGKAAWLSSGQPGTIDPSKGSTESYSFSARQEMTLGQRHQAGFNTAWRLMRDNWYDDRFNNKNWDAIRRKYEPAAAHATSSGELAEVVSMMLGELNGSHLGFYPSGGGRSSQSWRPQTAHLGIRFDPGHNGPGLLVRDVILDGPADEVESKVKPGETILSIDGTSVDPDLDLTTILNGPIDRDIDLIVKSVEGEERTITIRPTTYGSARSRLYPQFIEQSREIVDKLSNGKLGYLHIQAMNMSSFLEFERQLYNVGYGKDGLIIDVRENGGGFTTDHLLTALTQPRHAITVPRGGGRGYPHDRLIYASWHKPITVLCNQNSFSNAEIFSHAIKGLKRGKVVGVRTAGGVISTGAAQVMDLGILRQPFRGWFVKWTGEDMELNGAQPHHELWPEPGELPRGKDRQLEKAIQVLKKDVKKYNKQPEVELIKNSERED